MGKKKHKKSRKHKDSAFENRSASSGYGGGGMGRRARDMYANAERFAEGMPHLLKSRQSEQFLLGALVGAAAAYVLTDEEVRGKLIKTGIKLYSNVVGGFEEMKEQVADLKAEIEAERQGAE